MKFLRFVFLLLLLLSASIFLSRLKVQQTLTANKHQREPQFIDTEKCFNAMWNYFKSHRGDFRGEVGHHALLDKLILLRAELGKTARLPRGQWAMIDVGANTGQYVPYYRSLFNDTPSTLHLIEPNPMNVQYLIKQFGHLPDIKIHNVGVYNETKFATFDAAKQLQKEGNQFAHITTIPVQYAPNVSTTWNTFETRVETLDTLFKENINNPEVELVLLKTDTVGSDLLVMLGAPRLLSKVRLFIFDCNVLQRVEHGGPGNIHLQAAQFLSDLGFDVFKLSAAQFVLFSGTFYSPIVDDPKFMNWHNCFAIRRSDPLWTSIFRKSNSLDDCQLRDE